MVEEGTEDDQFKAVMDEAKEVSAYSSLCVAQLQHCYWATINILQKKENGKFFFFFIVFAPRMPASALVRDQITRRKSLWNTITTTMLISLVLSNDALTGTCSVLLF